MHFLINSKLSLDIIAMVGSIALVVWSYQIKNGKMLAMVGGFLLFLISFLSMASTGFYGGKIIVMGDKTHMMIEQNLMENMPHQAEKVPQ